MGLFSRKSKSAQENKTIQLKTNINCGGCVSTVTPFLDGADGIQEWSVDTTNSDKILTVEAKGLSEKEIIAIVQKAGYKAESIK